jgi:hypothetical protein
MANANVANMTLNQPNDVFHTVWKTSRTMIAGGWKYKASGNGQASGSTNISPSGTAGTVTAFANPLSTMGGLTNMTPNVVGQRITVSGGTHGGNDGTFIITSYVSATSVVVYNPSGVSTDSGLTWSLATDESFDLWAVGGAVQLSSTSRGSGSGTGVSIAASNAASGFSTISGVTGFTQASVGCYLVITGSVSTTGPLPSNTNNGTFRIVSQTGTTVTVYAPSLVAETSNSFLTVTEEAGGLAANITTFTTVTSGQSTLINVTGLTGMSASVVGKMLTIFGAANQANNGTFPIAAYVSATSVSIYNPSAVQTDANNGSLTWVVVDPLQQVYPGYLQYYNSADHGSGAWIILQGPTTMKIPIGSNAVTGTFIRGENIVQTGTGAQGELLGVVTDTTGGTGYLVVAPRVLGTGSSVALYGWNNSTTDTITGGLSGATVTSTAGPPIAYIREMVIWKDTFSFGHIYYQCIDQSSTTESATTANTGRFSTMANTLSAVTSQVPPAGSTGGSPVTNGFPTVGTLVFIGTGGSGASSTGHAGWDGFSNYTTNGKFHVMVANNIEQQGVSQDGSWIFAQSLSSNAYNGYAFQRMDNNEDGDLDPYTCVCIGGLGNDGPTRTVNTSGGNATTDLFTMFATWITNTSQSNCNWRGFYRRGLPVGPNGFGDQYQPFSPAYLYDPGTSAFILITSGNQGYPDRVGTAVLETYVREPIWVYSGGTVGQPRMRKGTPRWMMITQGLNINQTTDSLKWICLSNTNPQMFCGPWDGVTTPTF